ncbi:MAG: hypothetical protein ACUVQP_00070 [Bacteroidales bacterium]
MAKILIGINTLTEVDAQVYSNHLAFFYHLGKLSEHEFILFTPRRFSIDRMRNTAATIALENDCDYLMFIDDDMLLNIFTLENLIDANKDIVMAHTYIRGYPFKPMAFKIIGDANANDFTVQHYDDLLENVDTKGLVDVDAVGFATVLIKTHLFKKLSKPFFVTTLNGTEDVYFCLRCKMELDNVSIAVDTRCPTGHLLDKEAISTATLKPLKEYYEALGFGQKEEIDRGDSYLKDIKKAVEME